MTLSLKKSPVLLLTLLLILSGGQNGFAQKVQEASLPSVVADSVRPLLEKVQLAYQKAAYLSFEVNYLYANEGRPNETNDSLTGSFQLDKGRCHFIIDGTETLIDSIHTIQISGNDKIIYLSKAASAGMMDPKSIADSICAHLKGASIQLHTYGNTAVISITFPTGQMYKQMEMAIDRQSGFMQRVTYDLYTEGLVGEALVRSAGHDGPYDSEGRVQMVYSNYRQGGCGESAFSEDHFISKIAGKYQPAARYKDYQLFLASPNL